MAADRRLDSDLKTQLTTEQPKYQMEPSGWVCDEVRLWLLLSLHERFPQHRVRRRDRGPGEDSLPPDDVPVEIPGEGGALDRQPAGDVSRGELHHQPGLSQGEAGVGQLLGVAGEMRDLHSGF